MIISNIEDTITNIFVLLSNRRFPKTLTLNFFRQGLSILSFFFLSKEGTNRFFIGKTLTRINKILHRYSINPKGINDNCFTTLTIFFLYDAFKAASIYNINLSHNKIIPRIKKNLLVHITNYYSLLQGDNIEFEFKNQLNTIINIFILIHKYLHFP